MASTRDRFSKFDARQRHFWANRTNQRDFSHPVVHGYWKQRAEFIRPFLANAQVETALDLGCGDGWGILALREHGLKVYGCDSSAAMLSNNPATGGLALADAYHLPYRDGSFDLVNCWELLHHVENPLAVVSEMARVSRRYITIFEPNCLNPALALFGMTVPEERGLLRFTPWYLQNLLRNAGLQLLQSLTVGCFTPNKTPTWAFHILKRLPYQWPLVGASNVVIAQVVT